MVDYSISKAYYTFLPPKHRKSMKKFFASLLALVGMVAGLALTSCGGGGGQTSLDNTNIIVTGGGATYQISFGSKLEGTGFYNATIGSLDGDIAAAALISGDVTNNKTDTETGLPSALTCTISMSEWKNESTVVFATILGGGYKENVNGFSANNLTFTLTKENGDYVLIWNWDGEAKYTTPGTAANTTVDHPLGNGGFSPVTHTGVAVTRG